MNTPIAEISVAETLAEKIVALKPGSLPDDHAQMRGPA